MFNTYGLPQLPDGFQLEGQPQPAITQLSDSELMKQMGNAPATPPLPAGYQMESQRPVSDSFWDMPDVVSARQWAGNAASDVAKSAGVGLAKGAIGMVGLPADLNAMAAHGVDAVARYLGYDVATPPSDDPGVGAAGIQRWVESKTGPMYQPQTGLGQYAQTIGEFAPAVIGGPESIAAKLATRVVAPAIASEAAGQATQGTDAEPYARVAAALLGAGAAGKLASTVADSRAASARAAATPDVAALKDEARAQYQHPDVAAVQIHPDAATALADTISSDLRSRGFRPASGAERNVFSAVGELTPSDTAAALPPAGSTISAATYKNLQNAQPAAVSVADIDSVRKRLGVIAKAKDVTGAPTSEAAAAKVAIGHIDNFLPNLAQGDLVAGDAAKANTILNDARQNWAAAKRAELVNTKLDNAELMAASTYGGGNINNATRQQFRPLLMNNAAKAAGYSDEAMAALNNVVRGNLVGNTARQIGRLAPTGPVGMGLNIGTALGTHGGSLAAIPITYAAKKIGEAMTRNAVNKLSVTLRQDSPLARTMTPAAYQRLKDANPTLVAMMEAMLAGQATPQPQPMAALP